MTSPKLDEAIDALEVPGAEVHVWTSSAELARLALSRLGDRARERGLAVELRFGFGELRRSDRRGRIRVAPQAVRPHGHTPPTLELDLTDA